MMKTAINNKLAEDIATRLATGLKIKSYEGRLNAQEALRKSLTQIWERAGGPADRTPEEFLSPNCLLRGVSSIGTENRRKSLGAAQCH
jgi:hypothetical protein